MRFVAVLSNLTPDECAVAVAEGRRAVFIDDGGAGHHDLPPEVLAQDFELFVAVVLDSEACSKLDTLHDDWLRDARLDAPGVVELHSTDLVNPKKAKSPWHGVPEERRAFHLQRAYDMVPETVAEIHFGYIGGEQYKELIERARVNHPGEEIHKHYRNQKRGLARNFYKVLADHFIEAQHEVVVFQDEGFHPGWSQEPIFDAQVPVWEKSIIHAPSYALAGIQLADLIAWTINRHYVAKARPTLRSFDVLALNALSSLVPKMKSAW